ncbi:UvrB/UvrC motif-containing protein [Pyxidicoccus parkwayensis]|uniref:UvrB/UvrC motif-containing protein n=1 Tax=Pyxidicoccus parkwayensis TaxID=2813578 RepID=A0ABX7NWU7_9BACT|nr:UvrB/UvrC motif-containing protein [Pyxidicoccus parkwaysis]QSQ23354.1 UvrB/UvrC motif-containing protein [Pyxidicoccus parkwaysis]
MASRVESLLAHVREHAENRPGVYRMFGPSGELLYVGKSVRVRTRLLSYFRADEREKAAEIISHAHKVEWEYTASEFAALLHEFRLIKAQRPLYNVEHKRDRGHCFIHLTREAVPRLRVVARANGESGDYFGPFHGRDSLTEVVRAVSDLLELRDCPADTPMRLADQFQLFPVEQEPLCMRGQLSRCLAPCAGRCTHAEYHARVVQARAFLEGTSDTPLTLLRERMALAARRLQFEYAAELRDRAERLELMRGWIVELGRTLKQLSFVYTVPGHGGEDRTYVVRRGSVRDELPAPGSSEEHAALEARAREIFERPEPETLGLRAHEAQEVMLIARWFRLHPEELERTRPAKQLLAPPGTSTSTP